LILKNQYALRALHFARVCFDVVSQWLR